jgi:hypothetical protein
MSKYRHVLHDKREEKLRSLLIHDFYSNNIKKKTLQIYQHGKSFNEMKVKIQKIRKKEG